MDEIDLRSADIAPPDMVMAGPLFVTGGNPATGPGAEFVKIADLNGDGKADLVVSNHGSGSDSIGVLLGNGDGTFLPIKAYPVGTTPNESVIGDFNGDGVPDIAVANQNSNNVSILLGSGGGSFRVAMNNNPLPAGGIFIARGDFNGDGKLDLVVTEQFGPNGKGVSVLIGNGDGTLQGAVPYAAGNQPLGVAVADFDRDGKPDLIVAGYRSNDVSVLHGNGDGTFQLLGSYGAGSAAEYVAVGDLNRDNKMDVVIANYTSNDLSVLFGNGDGTLQVAKPYPVGTTPTGLALGDFDGDGWLDAAVTNLGSKNVFVLLGDGKGKGGLGMPFVYPVSPGPAGIAAGDLNGDGRLDLAWANDNNTIGILINASR